MVIAQVGNLLKASGWVANSALVIFILARLNSLVGPIEVEVLGELIETCERWGQTKIEDAMCSRVRVEHRHERVLR